MFALLAKYCAIESRQHMHRLQSAAAVELMASNPVAAAASCNTSENTELEDIVAQMEISIYEVLSNVVALCTTLVSKSGKSKSVIDARVGFKVLLILALVVRLSFVGYS